MSDLPSDQPNNTLNNGAEASDTPAEPQPNQPAAAGAVGTVEAENPESVKAEAQKPETGKKPASSKAESKTSTKQSAKKKSGSSNFVVPLLIIAVFAGLVWLVVTGKIDLTPGKPGMIPLETTTTSTATKSTEPSKPAESTPVATEAKPVTTQQSAPAKAEMRMENHIASTPQQPSPRTTVSNAEARQLLDAVGGLSAELRQLHDEQAAMQQALAQQRQVNLEARLRWIADAASHLPQIQLAWEEIALLPGLTAGQRQTAESMLALAQKDSLSIRQWQANLEKWADTLVTPAHHNIIPQPRQQWLAWIAGKFSLSRAPDVEEARLESMRLALLDTSRRIGLESWPNKQDWQNLRARLLLQLQQMHLAETSNTPELGVPENFDAITGDIDKLRETARQWLGGNT